MSKALGKNPLFTVPEEEPVLTEKDIETIKASRYHVSDDFTAMSFKIRKKYLQKLRDYAYTERITVKEALDQALGQYLENIDDAQLLESPERARRPRRGN